MRAIFLSVSLLCTGCVLLSGYLFPLYCGDGFVTQSEGEECDDGNTTNGDGCDQGCNKEVPPGCGNGLIESPEECDDGNTTNGDGCNQGCQEEFCGDGIANNAGLEECDDGNQSDLDFCTNDCTLRACGDGILEPSEECDDGCLSGDPNRCDAQDNGDGCNQSCQLEFCGDGVDNNGDAEECDDGNQSQTDSCLADCTLPRCGDGFVQTNVEACDDGGNLDADGCEANCSLPACQNNIIDPGEVCFSQPEQISALVGLPMVLSSGDIDADGDIDFAVGAGSLGEVRIVKNDGLGLFSVDATLSQITNPVSLALGDLNNDNALDLAVVSQIASQDDRVLTFLNSSGVLSAPFSDEAIITAGDTLSSLAIGDLNNDGFNDIVVTSVTNLNAIALPLLPPNGVLGAEDLLIGVGAEPRAVALVDIDNNGRRDLVIAKGNQDKVAVSLNNGGFNFSAVVDTPVGDGPFFLISGDINDDNAIDIIALNRFSSTISILIGNNTASFDSQLSTTLQTGLNTPRTGALADVDGDALSDLLVSNEGSESVAVFLATGSGTFASSPVLVPTGAGTRPFSLSAADVDGDQDLDILLTDIGGTGAVLLLRGDP